MIRRRRSDTSSSAPIPGSASRWGRRRRSPQLSEDSSTSTKVVLNVGCGPPDPNKLPPRFRGPEWRELRLDIDPRVKPDIIGSIVDMSAVKSKSVDAVWSSHNLEHIYAHEVPVALRGFCRVLRPGGEVLIALPDLRWVAEAILNRDAEDPVLFSTELGPLAPLDVIYGHRLSIQQGNEYMAHRTGFTAASVALKMRQAGFTDVQVERRDFELLASARRPD